MARHAAGVIAALAIAGAGCASAPGRGVESGGDYLRYVGFELPFNENVLLHWPRRQMPLRVHLPMPPEGFYADAQAVHEVVRDGITDRSTRRCSTRWATRSAWPATAPTAAT
jgi:hypothetical protein